ncbi:MAG: DUF1007 family protein [Methylobacterium sp.]|uniref:DUF1007 family protein n=1 Tax=Methylobacterium sp. TaxID=409 RepID=UPI0025D5BD10|nr:DUF1007 family protein [Methylobacterium sp.]MBX9934462.1 DUF1007 family protein [Methylobacterium sp.]
MPHAPCLHRLALAAVSTLGLTGAALAHPHVWIISKVQIAYGSGGKVEGIRHAWTFDKSYSAFVTQGLDANGDGKLTPEELVALAAENTANLAEFGYFTKLKVGGKDQAFVDPVEPRMALEEGALTLSFLLPLKNPIVQGKGVAALEVYDPTYFVSFSLSDAADVATLKAAPTGCAVTVTRSKSDPAPTPQANAAKPGLSESFFEALTNASTYGAQFANRILVACP